MNVIVTDSPLNIETEYFEVKILNRPIHWPTFGAIVLIHLGALIAPFYFSWQGLACLIALYCYTGCIGITFCYHRMLTHRGFKLNAIAKWFAHLAGALALQGRPLDWAMSHRIHHARSDQKGDPHSPLDGSLWSHFLWLIPRRNKQTHALLIAKYTPDLLQDRCCVFFNRTYVLWNILLGAALLGFGGLSCFLWGFCLRTAMVWHMTWLINSATHIWGYRNYTTSDQSRNLWWVALVTFGEGWHNNHHAQPVAAYHGHRWWEIDATGWVISVCKVLRIATNVKNPKPMTANSQTETVYS
jgi:stearoyl-CoA desaturase (delta-9 desaturase)